MKHIDEHSWEPVDAKLVVVAKKEKMSRFKKMQVLSNAHVNKQEAEIDGKR